MKKKTKVIFGACLLLFVLCIAAGIFIFKNSTVQITKTGQSNLKKYWWDKGAERTQNLKNAQSAIRAKLPVKFYTGHTIYMDENNVPFIISGDSVMYLRKRGNEYILRPIDLVDLREEATGTRIEVFDTEELKNKWKEASLSKDSNVNINEYKSLKLEVDSGEKELYVEAIPVFDELSVKYTKDAKELKLSYTTVIGKVLEFTIPLGNKGNLFVDSATKGSFNTAYINENGKLMIEKGVLQDLLGFEVSGGGVGNNTVSVVSDYCDIKIPVVKKTENLDISKFYRVKSDGTFESSLATATDIAQSTTPKVGVASDSHVNQVSGVSGKTTTSKAPSSGGAKPGTGTTTHQQTTAPAENDIPETITYKGCTLVTLHGAIIHCYYDTIVGKIDVGNAVPSEAIKIVAARFKSAHPGWPVHVTEYSVEYARPKAPVVNNIGEVEIYCGNNPDSIKTMSAEQLYELARILPAVRGGGYGEYSDALYSAWLKMRWTINDNPYGRTVNGEIVR